MGMIDWSLGLLVAMESSKSWTSCMRLVFIHDHYL